MKRFKSLIQEIPLMEQVFTSNKSSWKKYLDKNNSIGDVFRTIFKNNTVQISRADLFKSAEQDNIEYFIIKTIIWGYPRGMRGNNFENIMEELPKLIDLLGEARLGVNNWSHHYEKVKKIKGLGLSTYSKLLYFAKIQVEGHFALILDNRIRIVLNSKQFSEFNSLEVIKYSNGNEMYIKYLELLDSLSVLLEADSGKIEMFIFEFGLNLKMET